jgi:hypothetical protein
VPIGPDDAKSKTCKKKIFMIRTYIVFNLDQVDGEQGAAEAFVAGAHQPCHACVILDRADRGQVCGQGLGAQLVDAGLVHEAGVQGADLLSVGVGGIGGAGLDEGAKLGLGVFLQAVEGAEAGLVGGNLSVLQIGPVGVFIEAVARLHRQVTTAEVKAPGVDLRRVSGSGRRRVASVRTRGGGG